MLIVLVMCLFWTVDFTDGHPRGFLFLHLLMSVDCYLKLFESSVSAMIFENSKYSSQRMVNGEWFHGIRLYFSPILQVGIAVSPLSNNIVYQEYETNPFRRFFQRGLNIALATDDPLLIHYTQNPLLEEFSIAAQIFSFSVFDLCEVARNSALQCSWDHESKKAWIGHHYQDREGAAANDIYRTNVPNARLQFRHFVLSEERAFIRSLGKSVGHEALASIDEEPPVTGVGVEEPLQTQSYADASSGIQCRIDNLLEMLHMLRSN